LANLSEKGTSIMIIPSPLPSPPPSGNIIIIIIIIIIILHGAKSFLRS
jgi:hypothetical protein